MQPSIRTILTTTEIFDNFNDAQLTLVAALCTPVTYNKGHMLMTENDLPDFVETKMGEEMRKYNAGLVFHLQPVKDIHLDSDYIMEFKANGNRQSVYFLSVVAALGLVDQTAFAILGNG